MWYTTLVPNRLQPSSGNNFFSQNFISQIRYDLKRQVKYFLVCHFLFIAFLGSAQIKSSNIQTIEGKKYYIHKIEKSQSLYGISKTYSVGLEDIYKANPELKTNGAKVNQEIKIPFAPTPAVVATNTLSLNSPSVAIDTTKYITYKVTKSETVYGITHRFNITEKQLATWNPGITPAALKEGQIIVVGEKVKKKMPVIKEKEPKIPSLTKEHKPGNLNIVDSSLFKPVSKPKKTKYNIALILPFRLEQTLAMDLTELVKTNSNFPTVPGLAVDFYLGFKHAVDSLRSKDFEVDILLYESDDKDSIKLEQIVKDPKFKELDFIFGPLYASGFKSISKKAKELNIPIVSPITQQNKILYNNIYISKTNPSQFTLLEGLADYCMDSLSASGANVILMLLSDKDKKELSFVSAFKKYYNERLKTVGRGFKDTLVIAKGINGLKSAYKSNMKNVIVTLSNNQVFLADFTTQLAMFDGKDMVLCGWQSVTESDNIDQEYLNQLNYVFPCQFNLTNLSAYANLEKSYLQEQQTMPTEYFYIGFDIAYYYMSNLRNLGPDFIYSLNNLPLETNYMRFKYARPDNTTGFDNRGLYIFRYSNYHLQKTGWK